MFTVNNTASQYLAFIALGIRNNSQEYGDYDRLLDKWDKGEAELIAACLPAAQAIASACDSISGVVTPGPRGLVEYDVAEKFGAYIARKIGQSGEFPDREGQRLALLDMFIAYIGKAENTASHASLNVLFKLKEVLPDV